MRSLYFICTGMILLAVFLTGCTAGPAPAPATSQATTVVQTTAPPALTLTPSLTSTTWNLTWFDDTKGVWSKVADGSIVTATFLNEGKVTGSGGCNGYSADYQLGEPNRIWFRRPTVPEHLCQSPLGIMNQESAFFTDLGWAETYNITNRQLLIFDKENRKILQFELPPS